MFSNLNALVVGPVLGGADLLQQAFGIRARVAVVQYRAHYVHSASWFNLFSQKLIYKYVERYI